MKEQFADYETSKMLKDIGFNEPCFGLYGIHGEFAYSHEAIQLYRPKNSQLTSCTTAPLWQQVKQWLWENKHIYVRFEKAYSFQLFVFQIGHGELSRNDDVGFNSPMSAEIEGMKIAVRHIHKNKKS